MFIETKNREIFIKKEIIKNTTLHLQSTEIEIVICTKGDLRSECNGEKRILKPGDMLIAFPHDIHGYVDNICGEGFLLIFNPDMSSEIKMQISKYKYSNFIHIPEVIPFFEKLNEEYHFDHSIITMAGYLHLIIGTIFKKLPKEKITKPTENDILTKSIVYIADNYSSKITLKSLAKHVGVSQNHLSRVFSEKVHQGFCKYLQQLRIYKARELLKTTDKTIYEILLESGFTNQKTFYRVFKAETGMSPKQYKNTHLNN